MLCFPVLLPIPVRILSAAFLQRSAYPEPSSETAFPSHSRDPSRSCIYAFLSSLESTLAKSRVSVDSKAFTENLTRLESTLMKNRGRGVWWLCRGHESRLTSLRSPRGWLLCQPPLCYSPCSPTIPPARGGDSRRHACPFRKSFSKFWSARFARPQSSCSPTAPASSANRQRAAAFILCATTFPSCCPKRPPSLPNKLWGRCGGLPAAACLQYAGHGL